MQAWKVTREMASRVQGLGKFGNFVIMVCRRGNPRKTYLGGPTMDDDLMKIHHCVPLETTLGPGSDWCVVTIFELFVNRAWCSRMVFMFGNFEVNNNNKKGRPCSAIG